MGRYVEGDGIHYWVTDEGSRFPVDIRVPSSPMRRDLFRQFVSKAAKVFRNASFRIDHDNTLTKRAKQWKKDQGIESLTFEELLKKVKANKAHIGQKVDGQSAIMEYKKSKAQFGSLAGRVMWSLPVLKEIESILKKRGIKQALIMGELAGMEKGKIIPFRESQHLIKNPRAEKEKLHWFPYQILETNGELVPDDYDSYVKAYETIKSLTKGAKYIHVPEDFEGGPEVLEKAWKKLVEKEGNEGIVVRVGDKVYKAKPVFTYDLVIVAVGSKKGKNWPKGQIGNTLMAFMDKDRNFRIAGEVGTGWNVAEKEDLFRWAQKNKVDEDDTYVWVKPQRIMEIQWERSNIKDMPAYKYSRGKYEKIDKKPVGTIVKPRFIRYRKDKSVSPSDLRLTQVPDWKEKTKMATEPLSFNEFICRHVRIMIDDPATDKHFPPQRAHMLYKLYKKLLAKGSPQALKYHRNVKPKGQNTNTPSKIRKMAKRIVKKALLSPSEALYGFAGWLTCQDEPTIMSGRNDAGNVAEKIDLFCKTNKLPDPRNGWEKQLTHPKTEKMVALPSMRRRADYPDHPDEIVISKSENILGGAPINELDVWSYYEGVKSKIIPELKGNDLFIVVKPDANPVYIRRPYDKKTAFIRINNDKEFETYHSGRTVEYHVTMGSETDKYIVDMDPSKTTPEDFQRAKKLAGEIADKLGDLPEVTAVDILYSGKRGFHIHGKLRSKKDTNDARNDLKEWIKETFGDRDDVNIGESPSGSKIAIGVSPMKLNGGHIACWSMRVSGLCCVEVPRSQLSGFKRESATPDKVHQKLARKPLKRIVRAGVDKYGQLTVNGSSILKIKIPKRDENDMLRDNVADALYSNADSNVGAMTPMELRTHYSVPISGLMRT